VKTFFRDHNNTLSKKWKLLVETFFFILENNTIHLEIFCIEHFGEFFVSPQTVLLPYTVMLETLKGTASLESKFTSSYKKSLTKYNFLKNVFFLELQALFLPTFFSTTKIKLSKNLIG